MDIMENIIFKLEDERPLSKIAIGIFAIMTGD
jgi:hypothetical protein